MPPASLIWPGQDMARPWAVPPKCDGTCFTHLNGVSIAHAQPAAKCGKVRSDPQNGYQKNWSLRVIREELANEVGRSVTPEEYQAIASDRMLRTRRVDREHPRASAALVNAQNELA